MIRRSESLSAARFKVRLIAAFVALAVIPGTSLANESCKLTGHVALVSVTLCGSKGCMPGSMKFEFVGDKILFYRNRNEPGGVVLRLGRSIDLLSDPLNYDADPQIRNRPETSNRATGEAWQRGERVGMSIVRQTTLRSTGEVLVTSRTDIEFRFPSCTACEMTRFDATVIGYNGELGLDHHLAGQSCTFQ